jgi:hypothetical protein
MVLAHNRWHREDPPRSGCISTASAYARCHSQARCYSEAVQPPGFVGRSLHVQDVQLTLPAFPSVLMLRYWKISVSQYSANDSPQHSQGPLKRLVR